MTDDHKAALGREQRAINRIYGAMVAMLIFSCVPLAAFQIVALVLLLYAVPGAYVLRSRSAKDSMAWNHMEYLIRTFWISSLICVIGLVCYIVYVLGSLSSAEIDATLNSLLQSLTDAAMTGQIALSDAVKRQGIAALITLAPSFIYFIYRVGAGLARAVRGHRIGNVKAWF